MKTKIILLAVLFIGFISNAQSIYKSSIDAGGATAVAGDIEMLYTIGETNLQELNIGDIKVSEGFISGNILEFALPTDDFTKTSFEISLFPNPAIEYFKISGLKEKTNLVIYDSNGKEVLRKRAYLNGEIDIKRLSSGVYIVRLSDETLNATKKIIKN